MISKTNWMYKGLEFLVRTIKKNCPNSKKVYFSCVFQDNFQTNQDASVENKVNLRLVNVEHVEKIINKKFSIFIKKNVEFYYCPYLWSLGTPCRWFIAPKSKVCVMIDVDMICCNKIDEIFELDKKKIHGCIALDNSVLFKEYQSLKEINLLGNYYLNFGFLVVPSEFLIFIGSKLLSHYPILKKEVGYFTGQVSLAHILKNHFDKKINVLPASRYNCYDRTIKDLINIEKPIFLHLLDSKEFVYSSSLMNTNKLSNYIFNIIRNDKKFI
jgi:lipopolysaccharide biosynthesis glycosyltransferase